MNGKETYERILFIKEYANRELEEVQTALEKENGYFADVEMYELALLKAREAIGLAEKYYIETINKREQIIKLLNTEEVTE